MEFFDLDAAAGYIAPRVKKEVGREFELDVDALVRHALALDIQYMLENGVIDAQGHALDGEYDEDDAFEYILDGLTERMGLDEDAEMAAAQALDAFTDYEAEYMEKAGFYE